MYNIYFSEGWDHLTIRGLAEKLKAAGINAELNEFEDAIRTKRGKYKHPIVLDSDTDLGAAKEIVDSYLKEAYFDDVPYDKDDQIIHHHSICLFDVTDTTLSWFLFDQFKDEFVHIESTRLS